MAELRIGSATDTGRIRPENEDNFLVTATAFVVADGMGGHEAGEVASQIAVDGIRQRLEDIATAAGITGEPAGSDPVTTLPTAAEFVESIAMANNDIFRAAIVNPAQRGMGTTVTAIAVIADPHGGRAAPNVGETADDEADEPGDVNAASPATSRPSPRPCPRKPWSSPTSATRAPTCSATAGCVASRSITATSKSWSPPVTSPRMRPGTHPRRNIITRALGIEPEVRVDWWTLPLIRGDRFVLCSDGLVDEVADTDITAVLVSNSDPQEAAERLVDTANAAGRPRQHHRHRGRRAGGGRTAGPDARDRRRADMGRRRQPADGGWHVVARRRRPVSDTGHLGTGRSDGAARPVCPRCRRARREEAPSRPRQVRRRLRCRSRHRDRVRRLFRVGRPWLLHCVQQRRSGDRLQGSEGGVLSIDPTAQYEAGPTRDQLEPDSAEMIDEGVRFDTQEEALDFLQDSATTHDDDHHDLTTTTTTTTTTVPTTDPITGLPVITTAATGASGASDGTPTGVTTTAAP